MSGLAKGGIAITSGSNLAIAGLQPSGVAVQGQVVWSAVAPQPQWELLSYTSQTGSPLVPAPAIDTTGANLIVIGTGSAAGITISDSQSNTWISTLFVSNNPVVELVYCINPATSSAHVFSSIAGAFPSFVVAAFRYSGGSILPGQSSTIASNSVTTPLPLPAITPAANSLLVSAAVSNGELGTTIISNPFTVISYLPRPTGYATALANAIAQDTTPVSPVWTPPSQAIVGNSAAVLMNFTPVPPSWQLLNTASMLAPTTTTAPIDTTGAGLIVVQVVSLYQGTVGLIDSAGNTWTRTTVVAQPATALETSLFYCINPATSTSHTFSVNSGLYNSVYVSAFQTPGTVIFDQIVTITANVNGVTLPALTPSAANSLLITGMGTNYGPTAITGNFIITGSNVQITGQVFGGGVAYLIQDTVIPVSPQWAISSLGMPYIAATMISFIPSP